MAGYARRKSTTSGVITPYSGPDQRGSIFDFDTTKLSVNTLEVGWPASRSMTSWDEYDIQIEFGDLGNILAYLSVGDQTREMERLVSALAEIRRR